MYIQYFAINLYILTYIHDTYMYLILFNTFICIKFVCI